MIRLMCENKLNTVQDVIDFQKEARERIDELSKEKRKCHDYIRKYKPASVPASEKSAPEKPKEEDKKPEQVDKHPDVPPEVIRAEKEILELSEEIRRIRKLIRTSEDLLENSKRVHQKAEGFGIHESPDGRVQLETPEEQLQSFDRKIDKYYDTLEQEAALRAAERKTKNRQRDSYER